MDAMRIHLQKNSVYLQDDNPDCREGFRSRKYDLHASQYLVST